MKVLVADDSPVVRQALSRLLESANHQVVVAEDGAEAISLLLAERPDLVLLDLRMPRVTGWVVCRLIKEDPVLSRIPVLVLTAFGGAEDRFWAEKSGADGFVTKDEMGSGLLERIQAVAAQRALAELSGGSSSTAEDVSDDVLARVCQVLDKQLFEATIVNEITTIGARSLDLRESLEETLKAVRRLVAFDVGAVGLLSERFVAVRMTKSLAPAAVDAFRGVVARHLGEIAGAALSADDLQEHRSADMGAELDDSVPFEQWGSVHVTHLQARGKVLGVLVLAAQGSNKFDDRVPRTMRAILPAIATVVDGARRFQQAISEEVSASLSSM
jgi:CheY-like chemotaxis protein